MDWSLVRNDSVDVCYGFGKLDRIVCFRMGGSEFCAGAAGDTQPVGVVFRGRVLWWIDYVFDVSDGVDRFASSETLRLVSGLWPGEFNAWSA